jgi:uncharacterized coiled-coil DUF342 family protein
MTQDERLDKIKEFLSTLKSEIDLPYFANADHRNFDDLRESIQDGNGFDIEIIYYSNAIKYLSENDPSLRESLRLAHEMGYETDKLNSEILASILASENAREDFNELETEINDFFEELNEEEENEEG